MNKTKHTPGPWIITQRPFSNARTIRYDGVPVATMNGQSYPLQINENACLVAAAPDLLEACQAALSYLEHVADSIEERCAESGCMCTMIGNVPHSQTLRDNEMAMVSAAIAKARVNHWDRSRSRPGQHDGEWEAGEREFEAQSG